MLIKILCVALLATSAFADFEVLTSPTVQKTSHIDLGKSGIKAREGNDVWGWTDPSNGKEYAIMGLNSKTSFVDITDASNPVHVADLKTATRSSTWRDIKVYKNFAFVVSEASRHGMQVINLEKLRAYSGTVMTLTSDLHYKKFGNAHNIAINEDTGYAYAVGSSTCDGGLHIMNIKDPMNPAFVNCVGRRVYEKPEKDGNAYTHDVQCVIYNGADSRYIGHEICVSSNEDSVNVVDVTDKANPFQISVSSYNAVKYTHQGWLTEDHNFFLLGDELDEQRLGVNTKTFIWDFRDLHNIKQSAIHSGSSKAIDHNMYVKGNYVYQANYTAGLRILALDQVEQGLLTEVGFMDILPAHNRAKFEGSWSVFPYFKSGSIVVSGINGVLYIAKANLK